MSERSPRGRTLPAIIGSILGSVCTFAAAGAAEAQVSVIDTDATATFIMIGNTLGLAGEVNANGPGTAGSIHTFTSVDSGSTDLTPANPSNPWSAGTTANWMVNSSSAVLTLPAGATVIHAELVWGGSYRYVDDVSSSINDAVTLATPLTTASITPRSSTAVTIDSLAAAGYALAYFVRSADVTAFVSAAADGTYTVGSVPGTQHEMVNSLNALGWALIVVVADDTLACRNLQLAILGAWVEDVQSVLIPFGGLSTPASGEVTGVLVTGAIEGDANSTGDGVSVFDPNTSGYTPLSGPNNPESNFFASQVNSASGALDTSGTWGFLNHDAASGINVVGGRQGWDQTGVRLSSLTSTLANGQSNTSILYSTSGDAFLVAFAGLETDTDASNCVPREIIFEDGFETRDTSSWSARLPVSEPTENSDSSCGNGLDDDLDGLTDCADPSCHGHPGVTVCAESNCTNLVDDDQDGTVDCDDSDCWSDMSCSEEAGDLLCTDEIDNDADGNTDCADPSCKETTALCTERACFDGLDNDGDGFTDCLDVDCIFAGVCPNTEALDATCSDGVDNDGNGFTDCQDLTCQRGPLVNVCEGSAVTCADGVDNDTDGFVDCLDHACRSCPSRSVSTCLPCS